MDLQLTGKRALVTGSSSGIGKGIAMVLAREGASVIVHGRTRDRTESVASAIREAGGEAQVALGDLATDDGAAAVSKAVHEGLGGVDILVNNIGGLEGSAGNVSWFDIRPEHWGASIQQNLIAAVRMVHAFVPAMRDRGWGRVINIASAGATEPPATVPDYCAAKAGVVNMTVSLSKALTRSGVTANAVSPGVTRTEMFERQLERIAGERGWPAEYESREALYMQLGTFPCATKGYGRPEDLGGLVAFLASPLSAFITGANYRIDGGQCQSVN